MAHSPIQRAIRRLEKRAFLAVWLGESARWLFVLSLISGALVLLARAGLDWPVEKASWLLLLIAAAPVIGWLLARGRRLTSQDAATWLDVRCGAGGALVTGAELPDERWAGRVTLALSELPALPRPRLGRPSASFCFGAAFAILALQIAIPKHEVGPSTQLFEAHVERLAEQLESLEELVELDEEVAAEMERRLEELAEHLDAENFESTYEALDRMEERLAQEAAKVRESAERANDQLNDAAGSAEKSPAEARESLQEALAKMRAAGLGKELPSALRDKLQSDSLALAGDLDLGSAEMMELSDALRDLMSAKLDGLTKAGLLSKHKGLAKAGKFASLEDFEEHVCDENCEKPGGT